MSVNHFCRSLRRAAFAGAAALVATAGLAQAATFSGEFWSLSSPSSDITQAVNAITGIAPTATFTSTAIDYPNGGQNIQASTGSLASFLGNDASSIVGDGTAPVETSVFRFTGYVDLLSGDQSFALGSDDGYRLTVNGVVVSERSSPRSFRFTTLNADPATGIVPVELIFYENFGRTGVEFFIDNTLAAPSTVPVPAGFPLILTALAALSALRLRKRVPAVDLSLAKPG